jgi:hypothetical protein
MNILSEKRHKRGLFGEGDQQERVGGEEKVMSGSPHFI